MVCILGNNVLSFNDIPGMQKKMYNLHLHVTKCRSLVVNHEYHFTRVNTLVNYYMGFFCTMICICKCMILYGPTVPEIKTVLFYEASWGVYEYNFFTSLYFCLFQTNVEQWCLPEESTVDVGNNIVYVEPSHTEVETIQAPYSLHRSKRHRCSHEHHMCIHIVI